MKPLKVLSALLFKLRDPRLHQAGEVVIDAREGGFVVVVDLHVAPISELAQTKREAEEAGAQRAAAAASIRRSELNEAVACQDFPSAKRHSRRRRHLHVGRLATDDWAVGFGFLNQLIHLYHFFIHRSGPDWRLLFLLHSSLKACL
jgi:hypothetical protein